MNPPTKNAVLLWRCTECGHVRTVIGSCSQTQNHEGTEPVETEAVWFVPVEVSE